jgi:hypothetical protein
MSAFLWIYALNLPFFLPLVWDWPGFVVCSNVMFLLPAFYLAQHEIWWEAFDFVQIGFVSAVYHWCDTPALALDSTFCVQAPNFHFLDHLFSLCIFTTIASPFLVRIHPHARGVYRMLAWCSTFLLYTLIEDTTTIFVVLSLVNVLVITWCLRTHMVTWHLLIPILPGIAAVWCYLASRDLSSTSRQYQWLHSLWHSLVATATRCLFEQFLHFLDPRYALIK